MTDSSNTATGTLGENTPVPSFESKKVMMRSENTDEISVETIGHCTVIQRTTTYFGPKLRIESHETGDQYLLHAPGPHSKLQLSNSAGEPVRKVAAELVSVKQYDICTHCQEPLKTAEHIRQSLIGACPSD